MATRSNERDSRERTGPIRVLLVDDSEDFLAGATAWVSSCPELDLAGTARGGREALEAVEAVRPDLVLMDAVMPDLDGFEATRRLKSRPDAPLVVILSFHESGAVRLEAWAAGADAFVAKAEIAERLLSVIRSIWTGEGGADDAGPRSGAVRPGGKRPVDAGDRPVARSPEKTERRMTNVTGFVRAILRALGIVGTTGGRSARGEWKRPAAATAPPIF